MVRTVDYSPRLEGHTANKCECECECESEIEFVLESLHLQR